MFSEDVCKAMETYGNDLVNSVMRRAEAVYRNYGPEVIIPIPIPILCYSNPFVRVMIWTYMACLQIKVERVVGCGEAKNVICGAVEKLKADTLIMGSHGYGFIKRYQTITSTVLE